MIYLRALRGAGRGRAAGYPMSVPLLRDLDRLAFRQPVTLLCGDNGSGKTTLMELLAMKLDAIRIDGRASRKAARFSPARAAFTLEMVRKPRRTFFFQAEDFIRYIDEWHAMREDARDALDEVNEAYADPYARGQAAMPHARTLAEMEGAYAGGLDERSHGEGFLDFFGARIIEGGLYLLDEPESALSPANQFVLLHLIRQAERAGCQLILSTHSPVLLAYPGACLYELRDGQAVETAYDELSHIDFLRAFLGDTKGFISRIDKDV